MITGTNITSKDIEKLKSDSDWFEIIGSTPLDQVETEILKRLNKGESFTKDKQYDLTTIGKGFKNGSIQLIKDTKRSKIFVSSFHINRQNGTNKVTNVTLYSFERKKDEKSGDSNWELMSKIKVPNDSQHEYPLVKLCKYIDTQLKLDGQELSSKYTKIVEGSTQKELETYSSLIEQVRGITNKDSMTELLRNIFENNETSELTKFLLDNDLLADDLRNAVEYKSRIVAVEELSKMLNSSLPEAAWQQWFQENSWVLGSDFVKILDERSIDVKHITDYLVEAYDGFLDIIEIKKPSESLKFWAQNKDHDNYFPHSDLIKAITQSLNYITQVENRIDSIEFRERVDNVTVIKPRCTLIFGRSIDWDDEQKHAYRILNSAYHNLTILTFDHVLERAKRMINNNIGRENLKDSQSKDPGVMNPEDLPF